MQPGLTGWAQVRYTYGATRRRRAGEAAVRPVLHQAPVDRASTCSSSSRRSRRSSLRQGRRDRRIRAVDARPASGRQRDDRRRRGLLPRQRVRRRRAAERAGTTLESRVVAQHRSAARRCSTSTASARRSSCSAGWPSAIPALVARIAARGHELASHGYWHRLVYDADAGRSSATTCAAPSDVIEDAAGVPRARLPRAELLDHRAVAVGARRADRGRLRLRRQHLPDPPRSLRHPRRAAASARDRRASRRRCVEVPRLHGARRLGAPSRCGGGYFRLLPYALTRWGIAPLSPRRAAAGHLLPAPVGNRSRPAAAARAPQSRLRHYNHLGRTESRLRRLLQDFAWDSVDSDTAARRRSGVRA